MTERVYETNKLEQRIWEMKKEGYKVIASAGIYGATLKRGNVVVTLIAK